MAATTQDTPKKGLEDIIAGSTAISFIDGREGRLIYRGYDIHDLVQGSFEEVAYLLLYGSLPTRAQLDTFLGQLQAEAVLPDSVITEIKELPAGVNAMEALRNIVGVLSFHDDESNDNSSEANFRKAIRLIAKTPLIVALIHRISTGQDVVLPKQGLGIAANFLYMLFGREASA